MIYHLKATLSIADIGTLMNSIPQEHSLEAYDSFVHLQEAEKTLTPESLKKSFESLELHSETDKEAIVNTVLMLVLEANCRRQLAEKLIDKYLSVEDNTDNEQGSK
jgi:hypothetical protein